MTYEVGLTPKAQRQLNHAAKWWAKNRSPIQAERWYKGFVEAIIGLSEKPEVRPLARENRKFPMEIRELRYGLGRRPTHRAVFVIRPHCVVVYAIRHLAQKDLTFDDL